MKEVHVLVTDGTRGLFVEATSGLSLLNYKHWPVYKKPLKTHWPCAIANHVTYNLMGPRKASKVARPFGLSKKASLYSIQLDSDDLEALVDNCKAVWRWHSLHGPFVGPFKLKLVALDVPIENFELITAHCIRSTRGL